MKRPKLLLVARFQDKTGTIEGRFNVKNLSHHVKNSNEKPETINNAITTPDFQG